MLTASIVVHNTPREQLEKALDCLLKSCVSKIYIIENSKKENLKKIHELDPRIIYKFIDNRGFGAGHNIAIREVIKENTDGYHLVMNPDVYWKGDILTSLIEYLKQNSDVGLIAPKIYYPDGQIQYSCRMLPSPIDLMGKRFLPWMLGKRLKKYLLIDHNHDLLINCPYMMGCFMLFRNKALLENGCFDERFFMYPEDIDITRRIHKNWKTVYWPKVSITHEHQQGSQKNLRLFMIHAFNMIKYFNKWGWFFDPERKLFNRQLRNEIKINTL